MINKVNEISASNIPVIEGCKQIYAANSLIYLHMIRKIRLLTKFVFFHHLRTFHCYKRSTN